MMKPYLLISLLFVAWPFSASASGTLQRGNDTEIQYYLDNPIAESLLVVFHGSDCNSVRHMDSVRTIWQEIKPDAAFLTIEKYGIDESLPYASGEQPDCPAEYLEHNTLAQRIEDGTQVVSALMGSYQQVILVGGSEGGSVALGVASQVPDIDAVLVLNAGSSSFQHDVEYSIQRTVPDDEREQVLQGFRQFAQQIIESDTRFPVEVSGHGYAFWKDILTRDLLAPLRQISAPVLIMQSTADESVDPNRTQHEVEKIISDGADTIQIVMLPDLDHGFRDSLGKQHLSSSLRGAVEWLENLNK